MILCDVTIGREAIVGAGKRGDQERSSTRGRGGKPYLCHSTKGFVIPTLRRTAAKQEFVDRRAKDIRRCVSVRVAVMGDDAAVAPHADLAMKVRRAVGGARPSLGSYGTTIELIGIMMLAVLLRALFLGKESLWWDEAVSVRIAGASWPGLADTLWNGQANMTFYYALLHLWLGLGRSEFALRALSAAVAVITIPQARSFGLPGSIADDTR